MSKQKEWLTYNQPHRFHQPTKCVSWDISADKKVHADQALHYC